MMGLSPAAVGAMSIGQWAAIVDARQAANGHVAPPTEDEFKAAIERGF